MTELRTASSQIPHQIPGSFLPASVLPRRYVPILPCSSDRNPSVGKFFWRMADCNAESLERRITPRNHPAIEAASIAARSDQYPKHVREGRKFPSTDFCPCWCPASTNWTPRYIRILATGLVRNPAARNFLFLQMEALICL